MSGKFCGTKNRSIVDTANGMHILRSQTLALPIFVSVLSTMRPMIRSEIPSKTFETARIVAMIPAFKPTAEVKKIVMKDPMIPLIILKANPPLP